ncbi:hypothetical protein ACEWY4_017248 [Coilia grayii]|uniref:Ig-like domain-containing protein n=1 Tax=Coilia grayii TaxID=363190 RepID=A0ABD1JGJ6_9TELE
MAGVSVFARISSCSKESPAALAQLHFWTSLPVAWKPIFPACTSADNLLFLTFVFCFLPECPVAWKPIFLRRESGCYNCPQLKGSACATSSSSPLRQCAGDQRPSHGEQEVATVTYQTRRTCVLQGSSVNIICSYSYPKGQKVTATHWLRGESPNTATRSILQHAPEYSGRVQYLGDGRGNCSVRISDLRVEDSGIYWFVFNTNGSGEPWTSSSGFKLSVTGLYCGSCMLSDAPAYAWLRDGHALATLQRSNELLLEPVQANDTGAYSCRVKGHPAVTSNPIRITVTCEQQLQVKVSPGQVREGERVELTCDTTCPISSNSLATFSWYKDRHLISQQNLRGPPQNQHQQLVLEAATPEDTGHYSCAMGGPLELRSPRVEMSVQFAPRTPSVSASPSGSVIEGGSVTLTCSSDANPPVENYTWFKVDESTPVGSGQQYSISNIRSEGGGQYYCEARNEHGAENSSAVSIRVKVNTGVPVTVVVCVVAVSVVVVMVGLAVLCAVKRRQKTSESSTHAAVAKTADPVQIDNTYSSVQLNPMSSDYENVMEAAPNPSHDTYMQLQFKSQSEYETLNLRNRAPDDMTDQPANDIRAPDDMTDQPANEIYETLDDITKSE